ncbi:hypothetical protein PLESTB_001102700 [Pleodorina starrii]|uniref:C2 domain-containing protein n=1 Tax=Pleodorina starrii TaxID=330485 RepID=A0A9W6BQX2_9CHLO|nr:hypothetical protein PLESTM_001337500 [Pleodorina starrii]GLC56418.1 hypothetical protein PLESTB_001102700 [Pleodorina starrii]GLC68918.1 hypothetical protein PLESTF_000758900 [Pleodorina starrii]
MALAGRLSQTPLLVEQHRQKLPAAAHMPMEPSCRLRSCRSGAQRHVRSGRAHRVPFRPVAALPFFRGASKSASDGADAASPGSHPAHPHPTFDLPMAVVLAGASFEAYLQPQGEQAFLQRSVRGPTVTFTDKSFLTETYSGVLVVELLAAANLRPADPNGLSDPYAVLSLGSSSCRSRTVSASLDPTWDERYYMYIKDPAADVLRVRLYDEDLAKSDDDLGLSMLGLGELADSQGEIKTYTLPLRGAGAGTGATVTLRCQLLSFSDAPPEEVAALTSTVTTAPSASAMAGLQAATAMIFAAPTELQAAVGTVLPKAEQGSGGGSGSGSGGDAEEVSATVALPSGEEVPNPWRVLAAMVGRATGLESLTPVAFVENEETDTQVWLYRNVELREAVVAFRGTEQIKWKDIATDLNLTPCSLNPERLDDNAGLPFAARIFRAVSGATQNQMMVHKGFLDAYDSVRRTVFSLLDEITGSGEKGDNWRVLVTGHSLGGALATLAAYELAERRTPARAVQAISLYTYGAPRVGNKAFAEEFDRLVPDAWRVSNINDIIPSVPRLMGYCHVGHAVRLGAEGSLRIGRSTAESTDVFGEGKAGVEVVQEIVNKISGEQARPWDEVYSEIAERELKLLDSLVGGQGLEEHLETFYLASLRQAVQAAAAAAAAAKEAATD